MPNPSRPGPAEPAQQQFVVSRLAWQPQRPFRLARPHSRRSRWPAVALAAATAITAAGVTACAGSGESPPAAVAPSVVSAPPQLAACLAGSRVPCYGQDPLHQVYDLGQLY